MQGKDCQRVRPQQHPPAQQDQAGQVSWDGEDLRHWAEEVQGDVWSRGLQLLDKQHHEHDFLRTQNVQLYRKFTVNQYLKRYKNIQNPIFKSAFH